MKKRLLSLALMTIFISLMALGSAAYFTVEGRATNVITTGTVELILTETSTDGTVVKDEDNNFIGLYFDKVMPSQTLDKHPVVENTGTQAFWLRVKVQPSMTASDGKTALPADVLDFNGLVTEGEAAPWMYDGKGWYYYTAPVAVGEKVELFSSVTLSPQMGNEYQDSTGLIEIQAQAVQTKNNDIPAEGTVLDIPGWPEENAQ